MLKNSKMWRPVANFAIRLLLTPMPFPPTDSAMTDKPYRVLLYYKFVPIVNPALVRDEQELTCRRLGLLGRILVAHEGINGTVSGTHDAVAQYQQYMQAHALFAGTEFKVDSADEHAFGRLNVRVKREVVNLGTAQPVDPNAGTAPYIEPEQMRDLLRSHPDDVVILDTRSRYEFEIGRFKNAITVEIDNFRQLPEHLQDLSHLKNKKIITYCTGGIRCEKVTALMLQQGFENVYQLHGGIIRYAHEMGGENFEGKCYVFDRRISVPVNNVNPTVIAHCHACGTATEQMVNCANVDCNKQVVLCAACADELEGCCSQACHQAPRRRVWNGKGQYWRGQNSKVFVGATTPS
jgi:UPF0176 protein